MSNSKASSTNTDKEVKRDIKKVVTRALSGFAPPLISNTVTNVITENSDESSSSSSLNTKYKSPAQSHQVHKAIDDETAMKDIKFIYSSVK